MANKSYQLSDAQRIIIHDALNHVISKGLFRPGYAPEFAEVFAMFQTEHAEPALAWNDPRFTKADRDLMLICVEEEISGSTRDLAVEQLENEPLIECIGYADLDPLETANVLRYLAAGNPDYVNGEFLRLNDNDGDDYSARLDYAKRMGLINEEETELTDLGREYLEAWRITND